MRNPVAVVNAASLPIKRPVPARAIFWPTVYGFDRQDNADSNRFPDINAIKRRQGARPAEQLVAFTEAASAAQDRILILDDYLFMTREYQTIQNRFDQILKWFPMKLVANEVRILTKASGSSVDRDSIVRTFNDRASAINKMTSSRLGRVSIEIKFTLKSTFRYVHDRFAVIDSELWHFGATVGGLHEDVNATTRGWDAEQHDAIKFFDAAWDGDPDLIKRARHA